MVKTTYKMHPAQCDGQSPLSLFSPKNKFKIDWQVLLTNPINGVII